MQKRKFDELISHFNCKVSDMSIDQKYKMELLGMISAIGFAHENELSTNLASLGTDCISREQAIDALRKLREEDIEDYGCEIPEGFNQDHLDRATFAIKQLPPIQPEPAQWVQMLINPRMYRCSNCNIAWNKRLVFDLDNGNEMVMQYCPCCGKKMLAEVDYE